jgi:hypothetical protein
VKINSTGGGDWSYLGLALIFMGIILLLLTPLSSVVYARYVLPKNNSAFKTAGQNTLVFTFIAVIAIALCGFSRLVIYVIAFLVWLFLLTLAAAALMKNMGDSLADADDVMLIPWVNHGVIWLVYMIALIVLHTLAPYSKLEETVLMILSVAFLVVVHPLVSLIYARKTYTQTAGRLKYAINSGAAFTVAFFLGYFDAGQYLEIIKGIIPMSLKPINFLQVLLFVVLAMLWGGVFPFIYYKYVKRKSVELDETVESLEA